MTDQPMYPPPPQPVESLVYYEGGDDGNRLYRLVLILVAVHAGIAVLYDTLGLLLNYLPLLFSPSPVQIWRWLYVLSGLAEMGFNLFLVFAVVFHLGSGGKRSWLIVAGWATGALVLLRLTGYVAPYFSGAMPFPAARWMQVVTSQALATLQQLLWPVLLLMAVWWERANAGKSPYGPRR